MKNYDKKVKANGANPKAYKLKAKQLKLGAVSCIHQIINLEQLKQETKKYDATVTQYLTAVLLYSIYNENYLKNTVPLFPSVSAWKISIFILFLKYVTLNKYPLFNVGPIYLHG